MSDAAAQSAAEPAAPHDHTGHHMDRDGGQSDASGRASTEGFHRRFNDAEKWAKEFDNPERDAWQKPEEVLDALHLQATSLVADIGAGTGYFSARIAKRVPEGKVFAADVEPAMVRYLAARAEREHLANLTPVQARADAANLPEPVDLIVVVDTYHHIDDRTRYFAALQSSLRPGGRLLIIDFKADSPNGPPAQHRIPPERVTHELAAAGYALTEKFEFLPRQYGLMFKKRDS
jgi:SAM-dependent methyltransferase